MSRLSQETRKPYCATAARKAAAGDVRALDAVGIFLTHAREHEVAFEVYEEALQRLTA